MEDDILIDQFGDDAIKYKSFLTYSWYSGLVPMVGGWFIFFLWAICESLGSSFAHSLPMIGVFWIMICFFIASAGLITLSIFSYLNRHNLPNKVFYSAALILFNIPCVFLIIYLFDEFNRTF